MKKNTKNILFIAIAAVLLILLFVSAYTFLHNDERLPIPASNSSSGSQSSVSHEAEGFENRNGTGNDSGSGNRSGFNAGNAGSDPVRVTPGGSGTVAQNVFVSGDFSPREWSFEKTVTIQATATKYPVQYIRWAAGDFTADTFPATPIASEYTGPFKVSGNGNITLYAQDTQGFKNVSVLTLEKIDNIAPTITSASLIPAAGIWGTQVKIETTVTDLESGVAAVKYAKGNFKAATFPVDTATDILLDGAGTGNFTVTANGKYTIYAKDNAGNEIVSIVSISNADAKKPAISGASLSADFNQKVVSFTVTDDLSGVSEVKYLQGTMSVSDFSILGDAATDKSGGNYEFTANANGKYTIYAKDNAGNEKIRVITVSGIDIKAPVIFIPMLSADFDQKTVSFTVTDDLSGVSEVKYLQGKKSVSDFSSSGSTATDKSGGDYEFTATTNGKYTIYAKDNVGNEKIRVITVSGIDKTAPAVSDLFMDQDPTPNKVLFKVTDSQSGVAVVKYLSGNHNVGDFSSISVLTESGGKYSFDIESGKNVYTIYTKDNVGNDRIRRINVNSIDTEAPVISEPAVSDVSAWKTVKTVSFTVTDNEEVALVQYAMGTFTKDAFDTTSGTELFRAGVSHDYSFDATANGVYTIFAQDATGNRVVKTVTVSMIDENIPQLGFSNTTVSGYSETLTVTISDPGESGVNTSASLWAKGTHTADDFESGSISGEWLPETLTFYRNGVYSFYAQDNAGRSAVETYQISSIHTGADSSSPLLIKNIEDIQRINDDMEEGNNAFYYRMENDIDFTSVANTWIPVGADGQTFAGVFDGNSKTIRGLISKADSDDGNIVKYQSLFGPTVGGTFKDLTLSYDSLSNNYYGNAFTTTPQTTSLDYCKVNNVWVFSPDKMANVIAEIEAQANQFDGNKNNKTTIAMHTLGYIRHVRYNGGNWDVMIEKPNASFTSYMAANSTKVHSIFSSGADIFVTDTYTKDGVIDFIHLDAPLNGIVSTKAPQKTVVFSITVYTTYEQDDLLGWAGDLQSYYNTAAGGTTDGIGKRNFGVFSQEDMYADLDAVNIGSMIMSINSSSSSKNVVNKNVSTAFAEYYSNPDRSEQKRFTLFVDNLDGRSSYATATFSGDIKTLDKATTYYTTNVTILGTAKWQIYPAGITDPNLLKLRKEFGTYIYTKAGRTVPAIYQ
ncbi:hypothetical protein [Methanolapillus ohkumae]|uniref:Uncharacterized protein n=1 Tax=Methanolapillus ohkumae TaxID=3028298 RepID=A0AA96VF37_9EURY|nr:hypothetical protein MsAm2_09870 [Methanosarcinaceae archaeon Am2]